MSRPVKPTIDSLIAEAEASIIHMAYLGAAFIPIQDILETSSTGRTELYVGSCWGGYAKPPFKSKNVSIIMLNQSKAETTNFQLLDMISDKILEIVKLEGIDKINYEGELEGGKVK